MSKTPVIKVSKKDLESLLGVTLDVPTIYRVLAKLKCEIEALGGDLIEYEANSDRPDLFSVEGLSRALRPWLGITWRSYTMVDSSVVGYARNIPERPYVALAVVKDLVLSDEAISQIMQLQEKITQTYGRARRKISIGVYDLEDLKPPIYYEQADPDTTRFKPLGENREMNLREILEKTEKGVLYGHIIRNMEKYPILRDSEGNILSLVPIINSEDCRVKPTTKKVIIDATGTSLEDVVSAVTIMATSIAERSKSGVIEAVKVYYEIGSVIEAPRRTTTPISVNVADVNRLLGTELSASEIVNMLEKFYYVVRELGDVILVQPPVYRIDVKSWVDVAEDVAIAYGYERLGSEANSLPVSSTPGRVHPIEYLSRRLREILVGLGLQEVANYMMSSRAVQLELLGLQSEMFLVDNPRSERFEGLRVWLAPQLLNVIKENSEKLSRIAIFEIGDVVVPSESHETRARIERRMGIAISHDKATLTDGLAYAKSILGELGIKPTFRKTSVPGFLPERTATIIGCDQELGFVGEVDPQVLYKLGVSNPVVIGEINVNKVLTHCTG